MSEKLEIRNKADIDRSLPLISIIGRPNVGKSTLFNRLIGERRAITDPTPGVTRDPIPARYLLGNHPVTLVDSGGVKLEKEGLDYAVSEKSLSLMEISDLILFVLECTELTGEDMMLIEELRPYSDKVILVINKIDISTQEHVMDLIGWWQEQLPKAEILPASAQEKFNLDNIFDAILEKLPEAPAWYDKDTFTDKNMRFFASEILREKIFLNYSQEVPYCCEVEIEEFKEGSERYDISAVIYVMRESQKGIIIGKGGQSLKKTGTQARLEMEDFFQKKIFLRIFVKVDPDWRENKKELRRFGYES